MARLHKAVRILHKVLAKVYVIFLLIPEIRTIKADSL